MTDTLRDKLIQKGWVTPFNADTLVRLIEEHYADEPAVPDEGREPAAVSEQPNWRGLCEDLLQALEGEGYANWPEGPDGNPLIENTRAALARWGNLKKSLTSSPQADGEVALDSCNRGLLPMIVSATGDPDEPELERIICSSISGGADYLNGMPRELSLQRITAEGSVFARYIQGPRSPELTLNSTEQPAPPADGEVAELVEWLYGTRAARLTRAAELLQWQALVPVSERLPGSEDCDEQGRCWAGTRAFVDTRGDRDIDYPPSWDLREVCAQDDVWLPAHALPLPEANND